MLENIDLSKTLKKKEGKELLEKLDTEVAALQRQARELKIPVMVVFEGWGASGKGRLINRMIQPLDPRGFKVHSIQKATQEEELHPYMWRFWNKIPSRGRMYIFDRSWYTRVMRERVDRNMTREQVVCAFNEINSFERMLTVDGMLIIKFFLHISKGEQKRRFEKLESSPETKWRVTREDWKHNKQYDEYFSICDEMLVNTDTEYAPWHVVEAEDDGYAAARILDCLVRSLRSRIQQETEREKQAEPYIQTAPPSGSSSPLAKADLSKDVKKDKYKETLKEYQKKLALLQSRIYQAKIPMVLGFEGWDAAGKGGAIKRLTECMDPRGYEVVPTASPNDYEKAHHYLWRFWTKMPHAGHIAIFDRTWYGRVMVERVEGFCTRAEWQRAYREINEMEEQLTEAGVIVLKFWIQIDKDEQERRFRARQENPEKSWKITEEDWRNRAKWDEYEPAVNEMIMKTSTAKAPWIVVEGNSKYYARLKVLKTVVEALEKRLGKETKQK